MRRSAVKPARRRAKQERAKKTIAVVLEAAAQVLQREGYARATTNRIADVAGVSVGTIYQYFSGKDGIFDALIRREIAGELAILAVSVPDPRRPLVESLRSVLEQLVRARPDAPVLYRALEQVPNAIFRRRIAEAREGVVAWMRELLRAYQKEIQVRDLDVAAFLLVSAAESVALNATPAFYRERGADELATLFTRYLTGGDG